MENSHRSRAHRAHRPPARPPYTSGGLHPTPPAYHRPTPSSSSSNSSMSDQHTTWALEETRNRGPVHGREYHGIMNGEHASWNDAVHRQSTTYRPVQYEPTPRRSTSHLVWGDVEEERRKWREEKERVRRAVEAERVRSRNLRGREYVARMVEEQNRRIEKRQSPDESRRVRFQLGY